MDVCLLSKAICGDKYTQGPLYAQIGHSLSDLIQLYEPNLIQLIDSNTLQDTNTPQDGGKPD